MEHKFLNLEHIEKKFPGVHALQDVSMYADCGEIVGLLGINGAGKSTLMNVISGVLQCDSGDIFVGGKKVTIRNPKDAEKNGIAIIPQETITFNYMTVAENLHINHLGRFVEKGKLNYKKLFAQTKEELKKIGCEVPPSVPIMDITIGQKQMVEIARALNQGKDIILFDEPTSSLTIREKEILFEVIGNLKAEGKVVIYISHFLDEVLEICDRFYVMRDGKMVANLPKEGTTMDTIIENMVGRKVVATKAEFNVKKNKPVLKVEGLNANRLVNNVSFEVYEGEVLAFWGLLGSGRTEIIRAMVGLDKATAGKITYYDNNGTAVNTHGNVLLDYCGYITENRHDDGLFLTQSVFKNFSMATLKKYSDKLGLMHNKKEMADSQKYVEKLEIKIPSQTAASEQLSGGNQQKLLIARWLNKKQRLYIFDEPTRGVDVNAKSQIHKLILQLTKEGNAVILISSEIEETMELASRYLVIRKGAVAATLNREEGTDTLLMKLCMEEEK